jgi:hypothetical protein
MDQATYLGMRERGGRKSLSLPAFELTAFAKALG